MALLHPEKVGIGAWEGGDPNNPSANGVVYAGLKPLKIKWYYNWHPTPLIGDDGIIPFYPAMWDRADITTPNLNAIQANGKLLIGFNEPWNNFGDPSRFGVSVSDALASWPQLMALGNRLASPSPSGNDGIGWLDQFMAGIASNGYRVDVVNVHYYAQYPNQDVNTFRDYLQFIRDRYSRPVIVTEWALYSNWGDTTNPQVPHQAQANWFTAAAQMMDALDYVERHAWFAAGTGAGGSLYLGSELLNADGSATVVGNAFASLLGDISPPPPPPPPPTPTNVSVRGTKAGTPGSYFETVFNALNAGVGSSGVGLANLSQSLTVGYPGDPNAAMYYSSGYAEWPGSGNTHTWASYGVGDVIGVFYKTLTIDFSKNGTVVGTASVEPSGSLYPLLSFAHSNDSATSNFGSTDMNFLPAGATSWDGTLTSGGRHAVSPETLPPLQQVAAAISGTPSGFNPNDKSPSVGLSNGNLTVTSNSGTGMVRGVTPGSTGGYFEFTFSAIISGSGNPGVGLANLTQSLAGYMGDPNGVGYFASGYAEWPGSGFDDIFVTYTNGDVIGVYLKASSVEFTKNGTLVGTATTLPSGSLYPAVLVANTGDVGIANFGSTNFAHLPVGATAWNAGGTGTGPRTATAAQTLGALGQVAGTMGSGAAGVILNPADKFTDIVLTNANLSATYTTSRPSGNVEVRGNTPGDPNSFFEVTFSTLVSGTSTAGLGIANLSQSLSTGFPGDPNAVAYYKVGFAAWPGTPGTTFSDTFDVGDVLGVFRKVVSVEFYKNGTLVGTATAVPTGDLYPFISLANNTDAATVNFGASAFAFPPAGSHAWGITGSTGPRSAQVAQTLPSISQVLIASGGTGLALTWDPAAMGSGITLSNGDLTASITSGSATQLRTTVGYSSGKHYAEMTLVSAGSGAALGIEDSTFGLSGFPGADGHGLGWYPNGWVGYNNNWVNIGNFNSSDIIGFAYDATAKRAWFSINGTWIGDPVAETGYIDMSSPGLTGAAYIMFGGVSGDSATINFGVSGFAFTPPTGFSTP